MTLLSCITCPSCVTFQWNRLLLGSCMCFTTKSYADLAICLLVRCCCCTAWRFESLATTACLSAVAVASYPNKWYVLKALRGAAQHMSHKPLLGQQCCHLKALLGPAALATSILVAGIAGLEQEQQFKSNSIIVQPLRPAAQADHVMHAHHMCLVSCTRSFAVGSIAAPLLSSVPWKPP